MDAVKASHKGPANKGKLTAFINPAGFIEQAVIGFVDEEVVQSGIKEIKRYIDKLEKDSSQILVLINLNQYGGSDISAHIAALKGIKQLSYRRIAAYGSVNVQVLFNSLAMIAAKQHKFKAFEKRIDAIQWLKGDSP